MPTISTVLLLLLLFVPLGAQADVTLAWNPYVQHPAPGPQATHFALQRCTVTAPQQECVPTVDLPAAVQLPISATGFTDTTVQVNELVCYHLLAVGGTRRSAPSNRCCAADIALTAPAGLACRVQ